MSHDEHDACRTLIPAYLAGELPDEDRARVEAHADACSECASQLESIEPVEVDEDPKQRLRDRLLRSLQEPRSAGRGGRVRSGVLVGALTFFLGLVGYVIAEIEPDGPWVMREVVTALDPPVQTLALGSPSSSPPLRREVPADVQASASDEPLIFFPEERSSNHEESSDGADPGTSSSFLSYIRGEAGGFRGRQGMRAEYDVMGVGAGGGGGGRYAASFGGRSQVADAKPDSFKPGALVEQFRAEAMKPQAQVAGATVAVKAAEAPTIQEEAPRMSRKIIRSGEMEFEIDSFDGAVGTLTKIAVEEAGFIATVNSEKLQNGKVRGTVVVRVPPDHLDTLLLKLRALGELKSQRIGSEDVTKHYLDLESRLRAARTMEERLIAIIKEGKGAIKDLLAAEKELGEWRTRIETMVGEINYYNNLIAHSTLTITLAEKEIRAPFGLLETERVEMGLEVEDVEKAYAEALAAVADAKGRVQRSELKQLGQGQFNAIVAFEVAPAQAGPLRDRLKQLGVLARLDINRSQEPQGGSGKPQEARLQQNDSQFLVSLYNLVTVAPRETVQVSLACADAEKAYKAVLDRAEKAAARIQSSTLSRQKAEQTTGRLQFQVRIADAEAVLQDIRAAGEVLKLEVTETPDPANTTRTKRGFLVNLYGLGGVQARETSTVVLASKDVPAGFRLLSEAVKAIDARVLAAALNENDRRNVTAALSVEIRREQETALADATAKAGAVYTRNSARAQDADNVTDSKVVLHLRLFDASNIPPRETVKLGIEVGDVDAVAKSLESEFKGRLIDAKHTRDAGGRRESALTVDLPLKEAAGAIERIKALGAVLEHVSTRNAGVPDNDLALARLELKLSNEVLVGRDAGPLANVKRGLAISLQAGSWALMLIMIGICFVGPLLFVVWAALKLRRRFSAKEAPAAPAV
ncbi:MAG: DUF4349 domain-containing protein [Planctomycetaceae bacterium]|nr:DUF4349 domain-containing protein [Planctomycetaceae bacterium]